MKETSHVQPHHLPDLRQDDLDRLRPACGRGEGTGAGRPVVRWTRPVGFDGAVHDQGELRTVSNLRPVKRAGLAAALVAAAVLLTGCSGAAVSTTAGPTATATPAAGASLSPSDFAAAAKLPNTVLLDVRTPAEFAAGHLAGAVNLDVESADFARSAAGLDPTRSYAIYCRSGNRSKAAMAALNQTGFSHLFALAGGIGAWQSAGGEVVTN